MDYDTIPYELLEEIFLNLDSEDLWRCLGVSKRWRDAANTDKLWEKQCSKLGIDEVPLDAIPGTEDLCQWAAAYYSQHLMPIKNWKLKQRRLFHVPVEDSHFIEVWEGNRGAVYYYKIDMLMIHEVYSHGVRSSELLSFFRALPREVFTLSIGINKNYIAVSNYNIVIVYKKSEAQSFQPFKIIYFISDNLKIEEYNDKLLKDSFSFDSTLQVKTIITDILWIGDTYGDNYFIVDLLNDSIRTVPDRAFFLCCIYTPLVASWDDEINLYDKYGNTVLQLGITCWELCFNSEILVIGVKETQKVETWEIKSAMKLVSKSVLYQTDMIIHPSKNIVVIAEKSKDIYRFTCIDAIKGFTLWRTYPPSQQNRCHLIKIVSEYVFVWYSYLSRTRYGVLDLSNGKTIYDGLLPQNRTHISNTLWVFLEYDHFKVMSYLG